MGDYFISFFLSLASKSNSKWHQIDHLLYLCGRSVNYYISKEWRALEYTTFNKVKQKVIRSGPGNTMVKYDLTNTF